MERRRARAAKAAPIDLQEAIDTSDVIGRWDWDIPNDRLYADATVAQLFSVDPGLAEAGASLSLFLDGIHPEDRARTAAMIALNAKAGRSYVQEYRVHSADGAMRWILARGLIELDPAGHPRRGTGILVDITPNRRSDAAVAALMPASRGHPLERAADHCMAARHALDALHEPLLRTMTDMLLLEIGSRLSRLEGRTDRTRLN